MARRFRFFPKKRGTRRTGSKWAGTVGEAAFFVALFLIGCAGLLVVLGSMFTRTFPAADYFPLVYYQRAMGQVVATRLVEDAASGERKLVSPQVLLVYQANDQLHEHWARDLGGPYQPDEAEALLEDFPANQRVRCWFDQDDPLNIIIRKPIAWNFWLTISVLAALVIIGTWGVIYTALRVGTSAERRAAIARRAAEIDQELSGDRHPSVREMPTVPRETNLINSPGVKLRYRLPVAPAPGWRLFAAAVLSLVGGAMAASFVALAVAQHLAGSPRWFLTLFSVPVAALGVWSIYYFLRELMAAAWIGPTTVEIAELPLFPAGEYDVYLHQPGNVRLEALRMLLVCDEETTYLQGTDVRHDQQRVYEEELYKKDNFDIDAATPLEEHLRLRVPPCGMHSYKSQFNAVSWKLVVELDAVGWPVTRRSFPLVVYPACLSLSQS